LKRFIFGLQRFAAISNEDSNKIITAVDDYDSVSNTGSNVQIYLGNGNDTIDNYGDAVTMSGGEGNNVIRNVGDNPVIMTGGGADYIYNRYGDYANITSGSGNDTVWQSYATYANISTGDGNDSVVVYTPDYSTGYAGPSTNLYVNLGSGNDTYTDSTSSYYYPEHNTIIGESGNNYIYSYGSYGAVYTGDGDDTIDGGTYSDYSTLNGGEGNNSIESAGDYSTIISGGGNDKIRVYGDYTTITAGAGNDSIYLSSSGNVINYTYGGGNDTITNFTASDTLQIASPVSYSTTKSGDNMYLSIGDQTITLQNVGLTVGRLNFVVTDTGTGTDTVSTYSGTYSGGNVTVTSYTDNEAINYQADFTGISFNSTDFMVNSSTGTLTIQNARDKLMNFAVNGNTVAYALMSGGGGEINGGSFSALTVFLGGNDASDVITAGSGGSSLWGGSGGYDTLTGGAGQDNFFFGKYDGADIINNASASDVVRLYDVSLSDIVSANVDGNVISANFNTGGSVQIYSTENLSPTFQLADSAYKYNQSTGQWQNA